MRKECINCGKIYEAKTSRSLYCSNKCKTYYRRYENKIEKKCKECGESFFDTTITHKSIFCSTSCASKNLHDRIIKEVSCIKCGRIFEFKGTTSPKYCKKCRRVRNVEITQSYNVRHGLMEEHNIGSGSGGLVSINNHCYKNGIGSYRKVKLASMKIIECENCHSTKNLEVHHIDYDRTNNEIDNLKLLCKSCHKKIHILRDENGRFI